MRDFTVDQEAQRLMSEASRLVVSAREAEKGSYEDALNLYEAALRKIETITSRYPKTKVASAIKKGEVKVGGYSVTAFKKNVVSQTRVKAHAEEDPLVCAWLVTQNLGEDHVRAWALSQIVREYARNGAYDKALRASGAISDSYTEGKVLVVLAGRQFKGGERKGALETLSEALRLARKMEDGWTKAEVLTRVAQQYLNVGQLGKSRKALSKALRAAKKRPCGFCAGAMIDIASTCAEFEKRDKALAILSEALRTIRGAITDPKFKAAILSRIARKYAEYDQNDRALQLARTINGAGYQAGALLSIGSKYLQIGQKDKAFQIFSQAFRVTEAEATNEIDEVTIPYLRVNVLVAAAREYFRAGVRGRPAVTLFKALQTVEAIKENYFSVRALLSIASGYATIGRRNKALEILSEALDETTTEETARKKAGLLPDIAAMYIELGERNRAMEILSEALPVAESIEMPPFRAFQLGEIAQKYLDAGESDEAFRIAQRIDDGLHKPVKFVQIACKYVETGRPIDGQVRKILHEIIADVEREDHLYGTRRTKDHSHGALVAIYPSCMMTDLDL